ncbi:uncharacterized protein LOC122247330 [Penaeus japonicus]|uniref:uncharacterized protein LOC122247330 n=1 Tax=Penaeus japonicus TaxID=27405 RepID=UPI001C70BC10|nr:uncharacterized protein LOC122247330 [Penaeus japonicus]
MEGLRIDLFNEINLIHGFVSGASGNQCRRLVQNLGLTLSLTALVMATTLAPSLAHPSYNFPPEVLNDPSVPYHDDPERPGYPPANGVKRGFWEKRAETTALHDGFDRELEVADYPVQEEWLRRARFPPGATADKRGFGSMMPQYLVNMYRPDVLNNLPKSLFSRTRPSTDRGRRSYD